MAYQHHIVLPVGYRLANFRLVLVLGHRGFGIAHRAVDQDLQQVMAIKKYVPREMAFQDRDPQLRQIRALQEEAAPFVGAES